MENVKLILIIDDDEDDVLLIKDRLSDFLHPACEYVVSDEKQRAVDYLREKAFDLCILDHRLGGYSGLDVLEAVAGIELATPIIMLTGQQDDEVAKLAIKNGAQDFVMKASIDEDVFEKSIRYAISRKELEFARLLSKQNEAENVAKDKFIAHLSHELRTPLTSILGYTSLIMENEEAEAFSKELNIISNNGKHLLNLLNDVLDLSKIAARKFELRPRKANFEQLLAEINALLSVNALDRGLSLEFFSETKLPKYINIDDTRFKQVLVNLIGNSIKFTDTGGIKVILSFQEHEGMAPHLIVVIKDSGIGMTPEQIKTIYEPFRQIEDVTNRKAGGAGLGLSITAEIVKHMQGNLDVESTQGESTTFTLTIPCHFETQSYIQYNFDTANDELNQVAAPYLSGKVLVVDDLFEIRRLAGFFVKQTGAQVEFAKHGKDAIDKILQANFERQPYDMVLMDLHMPVMTGKEVVKRLVNENLSPPVIAMTAAINKGLQKELDTIGFTGLIGKPIDKVQLWEALSIHLASASNKNAHPSKQSHVEDSARVDLVHLVEDDNDVAEIMTLMITQLGFSVSHSSSAREAIQLIKDNKAISTHLLDLGLPDIKGEQLLHEITRAQPSGQVIILSGQSIDPSLKKRFSVTDQYIKPISKETLASILRS